MGQCQQRRRTADSLEPFGGAIVKLQSRWSVMTNHLDALPVDPAREPGAERLHGRFLGREPRRERGGGITFAATISDFAIGEDAPHEMVAVAFDRSGNAVDLGGVHAGSYNVHLPSSSYMSLPPV